ncbi:MAG: hypothetical protein ACE148_11690 [Vicinamibacterales bacterium]
MNLTKTGFKRTALGAFVALLALAGAGRAAALRPHGASWGGAQQAKQPAGLQPAAQASPRQTPAPQQKPATEGGQPAPQAPPGAGRALGPQPAPAQAAVPQPGTTAPVPPPGRVPPPPEGYSYKPDGRRDPFLSLTARAVDPRATGKRPEGLAGLLVSEVALRGVMQAQGRFIATVQGPDMKSYLVRPGDRFLDGVVKAITADSLIIMVEVNDPLSLTKQREVRKTLRVVEEVK